MRLAGAENRRFKGRDVLGPIAAGFFLVLLSVIPQPALSEWRILGPMMAEPDWLDLPAVERAKQAEAEELARQRERDALQAWRVSEAQRRASMPRRAEAQSRDGLAKLSFGCSETGTIYISMVLTGYDTEAGIVRVTHWVDEQLPRRVPWFSISDDLELRVFTDRTVFVEQFLQSFSGGEAVTVQVETFPAVQFSSPNRAEIVAPILKNCQQLATEIDRPAPGTRDSQEMMDGDTG